MQSSIILISTLIIAGVLQVQCASNFEAMNESPFFNIEQLVDQFALNLFPSSQENADVVRKAFKDNFLLKCLFVWAGDDAKPLRDEVIRRMRIGDNAAAATAAAMLTPSTWKLNPNATRDEVVNPFVAKK